MKELVSIIVPAFNVEGYLESCIHSLLGQTYEKCEILLVDDGSTDGTGALCDELSGKYSGIKVKHQPNKGLSEARNTGIRMAAGEFLCFVDSDDTVSPYFVERLMEAQKKEQADLVFCDYEMVDMPKTVREEKTAPSSIKVYEKDEVYGILSDVCHSEKTKLVIACNKLYRSSLFEKLCFEPGRIHEDEFMIHHLVGEANKVVGIDDQLYYYYVRPGSITQNGGNYDERHLQVLEAYRDRVIFYKENCSRELYRNMLLAWFEMVTVEYLNLCRSEDPDLQSKIFHCSIKSYLKTYMRRSLWEYRKDVSFRKKGKYISFLINPGWYYRRFWKT